MAIPTPAIILLDIFPSLDEIGFPLMSNITDLFESLFLFIDLKINLKVSVTRLPTNTIAVASIIIDKGSFLTNILENT